MCWKQGWIVALILTATCAPQNAAQGADVIPEAQRTKAQESVRELERELDRLQQDIIEDMEGKDRFNLYGRVDRVEGNLESLYEKLDSQVKRADAYRTFDKVDREIHALMKIARNADHRNIRQSSRRVYFTDLELHYQLSLGDKSPERRLDVVQRQAEAFARAARQIHSTAVLALQAEVPTGIAKLAEKATALEKKAASLTSVAPVREAFLDLNREWILMTEEMAKLPPRQNRYLLRTAVRLDRLHKRLFELLDVPDTRQVLAVQI